MINHRRRTGVIVETVKDLVLVLHFLGLAAIIGGVLAQSRANPRRIDALVLHGSLTQLVTGLALVGFILGSELNLPNFGAIIVLSTVFLMGLHSTFFVPAKYGAMPEILPESLLSRGNGVLESLSFLATISPARRAATMARNASSTM